MAKSDIVYLLKKSRAANLGSATLSSRKLPPTINKDSPVETAKAFCQHKTEPLIYYRGGWYEWRGARYHEISTHTVKAELYDFLAKAKVKVKVKDKEGKEGWAETSFNPYKTYVDEVLDALMHLPKVFISEELDAPGWLRGQGNKPDPKNLIAMANGILELATGELLPHTPDFLTMTALPFDYDPAATCERWERFVAEIFPSEATRREFQKAIGYTLSSDQSQQKMLLMYGPARSGKGTTFRVLAGLLGRENTVSPKLSQFKQGFGMQQLIGKKAALFPDERLGKDTLPIVEKLLSLSGEDDLSIERKYQRNWEGRLPTKVWIATNTLPGFDDTSAVIVRRFIMFPLTRSFLGKEDPQLTETLLKELPGILIWAMQGIAMLREDGHFNQPLEAADAIESMADIAAPIRQFVRDRLVLAGDRSVEAKSAYTAYKTWCSENGNNPLSKGKFVTAIQDAFPAIKHKWVGPRGHQVEMLIGAALRQVGEAANDETVTRLDEVRAQRISQGMLDVG